MRGFTIVAGGWSKAVMAGLLVLVPGAAAADVSVFSKVRFPQDVKLPLEVSVGIVLVDFARINAREESFDIHGYLNLSWRVPSLAGKGQRRMFRDELWAPSIDFVNATEPVQLQNEAAFHVSDDGLVEERVRFGGRFASPLNLRRFPLDEQHLEVHIEPFERTIDEVVFRSTRPGSGGTRARSCPTGRSATCGPGAPRTTTRRSTRPAPASPWSSTSIAAARSTSGGSCCR